MQCCDDSQFIWLTRAIHIGGSRGGGYLPPPGKLNVFFPKLVFDFAGLFLVAILVRNLSTGDPCEGVRSLRPQINFLGTAL